MKRLLLILIAAGVSVSASAFDAMYRQGQTAYDEGRYDEAIRCYENIISNGAVNVEVHYNLANSLFKAGRLPEAVWHYRTAWYGAPRDPDITANLQFALSAVGAIEPHPSFMERSLTTLSAGEWVAVAVGSYLLLSILLILAFLLRSAQTTLRRLSLIPAVILLIAAWGWWQWRTLRVQPEAVVVSSGTTALFGPVEGATAHYKLPSGALVRLQGSDPKGWVEVEYDGKDGWVKMGDIKRLSP